ncbi:MAG: NADH-quinone oxidoreductase subunit L [Acidobacteriota bacterium]
MLGALWLIPLLPLLGFCLNGLFGKRWLARRAVEWTACGAVLAAFVVSLGAVWQLNEPGVLARLAADPPPHIQVDVDTRRVEVELWEWIPGGTAHTDAGRSFDLRVAWGFQIDPLASILLLVVTGVGFLIHVYSIGYMAHEQDYARFFTYLNLFMAMMLTLVLGANFLVMFVGWEGVGLCSYLLIGFFYQRPFDLKSGLTCADAGRKAFIVNRIGDFGFLMGMLLILVTFGSLDFSTVTERVMAQAPDLGPGVFTAIGLLLFVGAVGKSAQIPLYVWLPDAMAGPTPVSALIHAATMVTAGVYMVCRTSAIYIHAPVAMATVAVVGVSTAVFAALMGLAQNDIKKVLAYSTVSQLGYMFVAVGVGAYGAGVFHLMTHAFFKALLFLGAGSVIHGMSGEQDMRKMGGLRAKMKVTFWVMLVATLAISGVPGLSGFFSKDEILWRSFGATAGPGFTGHPAIWILGTLAAGLTAFYMFRLIFMTFYGEGRMDGETSHHLHESSWVMLAPLCVLAVLAAVGGYVGVPHALGGNNRFEAFIAPSFRHVEAPEGPAGAMFEAGHALGAPAATGPAVAGVQPASFRPDSQADGPGVEEHSRTGVEHENGGLEYVLMLASVLVAFSGIFLAWLFYVKIPALPARFATAMGALYRVVAGKFYVDEIYAATVLAGYYGLCRVSAWVDRNVIDGAVNGIRHLTIGISHVSSIFDRYVVDLAVNALAGLTRGLHLVVRRAQTGLVQSYAALMVFGVFLLVSLYLILLSG